MTSGIYAESFSAYTNARNINNTIQEKVNKIAENELLFNDVDYSQAYDSIIQNYETTLEEIETQQNSTNEEGVQDEEGTQDGEGAQSEGGGSTSEGGTVATEEQVAQLRETFEQTKDEQGWVGKAWDGIKNFFGHSNGSDAIEDTIAKAESGEISYEEAVEALNKYSQKQDSMVETFANVASGLAVAAGVIAAPFSFGASLALGAGLGAAVKVGIKASDAATNDVEGDYTLKNAAKDTVTGGVSGLVTAATAGIGTAGLTVAKEGGKVVVKEAIKQGAVAGVKAGAIDGAVMGATNYTADAVFDGDDFTFNGLVENTVTSAAGGALIGGVVGGVTSGLSARSANRAAAGAADDIADAAGDATQATATANIADDVTDDIADDVAGAAGAADDIADDVAGAAGAADDAADAAGTSNIKATKTAGGLSQDEYDKVLQFVADNNEEGLYNYLKELMENGRLRESDLIELADSLRQNINYTNAAGTADDVADDIAGAAGVADDIAGAAGVADDAAGVADDATDDIAGAAGAADETAQQSSRTIKETIQNAKENLFNLLKKGADIRNMTPKDVREAFTGKANASLNEFKAAYEAMKQTNDYQTNLVFRTFIEDLFNIGIREDV